MSDPPSPPPPPTSSSSILLRVYRKGNWTLQETLILINAKHLDDERRAESKIHSSSGSPRSAELRWKWVENFCWNNQCLRSQNQCNDKWDNLLRDYKKVRDYQTKLTSSSSSSSSSSYWAMEKHERKERNLPSNMASDVFDALMDVITRRNVLKITQPSSTSKVVPVLLTLPSPVPLPVPLPLPMTMTPQQQRETPAAPADEVAVTVPPPPLVQTPALQVATLLSDMSESSDTDGDNRVEPEPKRQRIRSVGSSVVRASSVLARTLLSCEEKREKRHRDLVELQERRLRIESERTEMNRQGFTTLINAVNSFSGAIHSLVSNNRKGDDDNT